MNGPLVQNAHSSAGAAIDWSAYQIPASYRLICPMCGRGPRDSKTMGLTRRDNGFGLSHCFRCSYSEVEPSRSSRTTVVHRPLQPIAKPHASSTGQGGLADWAQQLWSDCQPIAGVAATYLRHRRCRIPPPDGDLRWHPALRHPSGYSGPALVALVTHVQTQARMSLHRTWITETGKANLGDRCRMMLKGHSTTDGVIRLWPQAQLTNKLGIAEGIETALSIGDLPVWSTLDAGHLGRFPVVEAIEDLYIARDRDAAGEQAAHDCARRWSAAGRRVWVSAQTDGDLNDLLTGRPA